MDGNGLFAQALDDIYDSVVDQSALERLPAALARLQAAQSSSSQVEADTELSQFDRVLPHLHRAQQLRRRLELAEASAGTGFAGLGALSFAVVICDAAGLVRFANGAALALGGAGLSFGCVARPLAACRPAGTRALRRLVRDAATGGAGGALRIDDDRGGVLLAMVTPLPPALGDGASSGGLALLALRPAGEAPAFGRAVLAALFGLTAAESELALALLSPRPLDAIAAGRGVSMATVRTQLRAVLAKTGTETQRDLVRLLGAIPQIAQPDHPLG